MTHFDGLRARARSTRAEFRRAASGRSAADVDRARRGASVAAPRAGRRDARGRRRRPTCPATCSSKMDIATMAHSLEARSPLLDHELMEFAASLPAELQGARRREEGGPARGAARLAARTRSSTGPSRASRVPLADWLRGELRELRARRPARPGARVDRGYFEPDAVARLLDRHAAGGDDDRSQRIWALLMLELWHREFVDVGTGAALPAWPDAQAGGDLFVLGHGSSHPHRLARPQRGRAHRARRPRGRGAGAPARALDRRRRPLRRRHAEILRALERRGARS